MDVPNLPPMSFRLKQCSHIDNCPGNFLFVWLVLLLFVISSMCLACLPDFEETIKPSGAPAPPKGQSGAEWLHWYELDMGLEVLASESWVQVLLLII